MVVVYHIILPLLHVHMTGLYNNPLAEPSTSSYVSSHDHWVIGGTKTIPL